MKDTKFYPLLAISIVLLLASFILLCILGYNFYTKAQDQKKIALTAKNNNAPSVNTRDSLQKIYTATINNFQLNNQDSALSKEDSVRFNLGSKISDFYKLRTEIAGLLKEDAPAADLSLARQKIGELQLKLEELKNRNIDIENENRRLNAMLAEFTSQNNVVQNTKSEERTTGERTTGESFFTASELRLAANNENNNEVSDAETTEKFTGSFAVKNNTNLNNAELVVVVVQPDGKVLKNAWESGSFETKDGKKIYSRKIKFDYSKGEIKRLNFSLDTDNCQKGNYTMQLYSKGKLIGKTVKTVS